MGGMHGFGALVFDQHESGFHHAWEGRVWAMSSAVMARTTIDRFRFVIEQMPPAAYLASSYYERWLWAIEYLAAEQRLFDGADTTAVVIRPSPDVALWEGRFHSGERVRVANRVTADHCRVPRYLRRAEGRIEWLACAWPNPTASAATGTYGKAELVYTVAFNAADLFGPSADHTVTADLAESDLETA
jgi:hypothetical protein